MQHSLNLITPEEAGTLANLFRIRVTRSGGKRAYIHFDRQQQEWIETNWSEMGHEVARWQSALKAEGLVLGDRVAILLHNCREWVMFDQAALGLGLVTVPLYVDDHPGNINYILAETDSRLLVTETAEQWQAIEKEKTHLPSLQRIVTLERVGESTIPMLLGVDRWLPLITLKELETINCEPDDLATIVYTSGTTGNPKGVMLSNRNILFDARAGLEKISVFEDDIFLSFLPLSHTLERTIGYYIPIMTGATVAYARSIAELAEDLQMIHPTVLISVPRIFERVYAKLRDQLKAKSETARYLFQLAVSVGWERFEYQQGRGQWHARLLLWPILKLLVAGKVMSKLGGHLRFAISGGAPLNRSISELFLGLGLPLVQGYGLTETSPVISVNQLNDNAPSSVGTLLRGMEAKTDSHHELLVRGPMVMLGYWRHPEATAEVIDGDGWLHTGDIAEVDSEGHISITGRIKDIIVLSTGEKVSPGDMEQAVLLDPLFDQIMVVGEQHPFLTALIILNQNELKTLLNELGIETPLPEVLGSGQLHHLVLEKLRQALHNFPAYANIKRVELLNDSWNIENRLQTPTMKNRRRQINEYYSGVIERLYQEH